MGIRENRDKIVTKWQDAWNKFTGVHHCLGIGLVEFLIMLAVVSLSLGLASMIVGLAAIGLEGSATMICITCAGVHRVVISATMVATIRWPSRRVVAFYLANDILHFLFAATCVVVDSMPLARQLHPFYKTSFQPCSNLRASTLSPAVIEKDSMRLSLTILSLYLEIVSLVLALTGLVCGLRIRRYIVARQRFDLARASREEIGRVFGVENRLPLPWPPFPHRMSGLPQKPSPKKQSNA